MTSEFHILLRKILVTCMSLQTCHNRVPQTGWLKQQKFISSQFWRLEVQIKVSSGLVFPEAPLLGLQMASCVLTWSSLCGCVSLVSLPVS